VIVILAVSLFNCRTTQFFVRNESAEEIEITTPERLLRNEIVDYNIADVHVDSGGLRSYYIDSVYQMELPPKSSSSVFLKRKFIRTNDRSLSQIVTQNSIIVDTVIIDLKLFKYTYKYVFKNTISK
jgi:hypothetical protein